MVSRESWLSRKARRRKNHIFVAAVVLVGALFVSLAVLVRVSRAIVVNDPVWDQLDKAGANREWMMAEIFNFLGAALHIDLIALVAGLLFLWILWKNMYQAPAKGATG